MKEVEFIYEEYRLDDMKKFSDLKVYMTIKTMI